MLHGVTVEKLWTIATSGLASASSSKPAAWSIARAGRARGALDHLARRQMLLKLMAILSLFGYNLRL